MAGQWYIQWRDLDGVTSTAAPWLVAVSSSSELLLASDSSSIHHFTPPGKCIVGMAASCTVISTTRTFLCAELTVGPRWTSLDLGVGGARWTSLDLGCWGAQVAAAWADSGRQAQVAAAYVDSGRQATWEASRVGNPAFAAPPAWTPPHCAQPGCTSKAMSSQCTFCRQDCLRRDPDPRCRAHRRR